MSGGVDDYNKSRCVALRNQCKQLDIYLDDGTIEVVFNGNQSCTFAKFGQTGGEKVKVSGPYNGEVKYYYKIIKN